MSFKDPTRISISKPAASVASAVSPSQFIGLSVLTGLSPSQWPLSVAHFILISGGKTAINAIVSIYGPRKNTVTKLSEIVI